MKPLFLHPALSVLFLILSFFCIESYAENDTDTSHIYSLTENSVYQIRVIHKDTGKKSSIGSGFVVEKNNIIATNYHVVSGFVNAPETYKLEYLSRHGDTGSLELLDLDVIHDLAILKTTHSMGSPLELDKVPPNGERIFSLGNPLDLGFSIIEGTNNGVMKNSEERNILVSGSLNPGMSGGPTLNTQGKVIGINVATTGNEISFVVPATHLKVILERLKERDFSPVDDTYAIMSSQLRLYAQDNLEQLMENNWGETNIGNFSVPSTLKESYRCWDTTPTYKKDVLFQQTSSSCSNDHNIFLSGKLEVGAISYEYHWFTTKVLEPIRFYRTYESMNQSNPPSAANKEHVTNFSCHTNFIELSGQDFKATLCRRDYHQYQGLSDVLFTMAMVGHKKQGMIFNLDLIGTDFESATTLLTKMLEKFKWQD